MSNPNKVTFLAIVNGTEVTLTENLNEPLHVIIPKALNKTEHKGQDPSKWQVKTEAGAELDPKMTLSEHGITEGSKVFISPRAGIGG